MNKSLFIDTHAHLDDAKYDLDRADVIQRAKDAGLKTIINVGCWDAKRGFASVVASTRQCDISYLTLGIHPHQAGLIRGEAVYDEMRRLALDMANRVVAIGETGLDYHYKDSSVDAQKAVFSAHIRIARELNLPLIIHTRDAAEDTMAMLRAEGVPQAGGVIHCFSGDWPMAEEAIRMGLYISFTGVITFPKSAALREVAKKTPIERILIETDCPYLAPMPHRGKRNEPAFVAHTAAELAQVKGLSVDDVARITTANAEELFGLRGPVERDEPAIAYPIRNSLYLNVTNRCTNQCTFCAKFKSYNVKGHYLRLREEPDLFECIRAIGPDPQKRYDEIVFCGFGEPLLRLSLVIELGLYLKKLGCRIRIDTDGLANLAHGMNVLPQLKFVDCISVSLNAPDSETYQRLIKTPYGDRSHPAIVYFLREAKKHIAKVVASVVAVPGLDIEACRKLAEDDIGVGFRVREYDNVG
ncbi:MAG: YchF/TatD family DNA exonuclease [Deltaproteobacteria bacterium]|nr:YchF/TatD family DNA exonuclease [Deltaproteobacteria bacterium]